MMNMTGADREKYLKEYTWNKEWVRPYESMFGILLNFCKVNVTGGEQALKMLNKPPEKDDKHFKVNQRLMMYYKKPDTSLYPDSIINALLPDWYIEEMSIFLNMNHTTMQNLIRSRVHICPECAKDGYHSVFHQLSNTNICPFHGIRIIEADNGHMKGIGYFAGAIIYDMNKDVFSNARNILHPSLRTKEPEFYKLDCCTTSGYASMTHVIPEGFDTYFSYAEYCRRMVRPENFMLQKHTYECMRINHHNGTVDELWRELIDEGTPLNAVYTVCCESPKIREYIEEYNIKSRLSDFYFFCKMRSFFKETSKEYQNHPNNLLMNETLHTDDIYKLKLSFLWALRASLYPKEALTIDWVLGRYQDSDYYIRHIWNGLHIRAVNLDMDDMDVSETDIIFVKLFLINDQFDCLWTQYYKLAERDEGVSVCDGWKELNVPEYYICNSKIGSDILIYRKRNQVSDP